MKSILLENGKIINIDADIMLWNSSDKTVTLKKEESVMGFVNIDKIVGIVDTKNLKEVK